MSLNNLGLGLLFEAKDLASGVIDRVKDKFSKLEDVSEDAKAKFTSGLGEFAKGAAMFGAGIATLRGAYGLAEAAAPFEESLAQVAYRTQASAEEMAGLKTAALDASASLKIVSETDAARAMAAFARGGNNAKDTMTALVPILKFAKAAIIDVGQASGIADNLMDVYGMKAEEIGVTTDKMMWAMRRFGMEAGELQTLFGPLAGMAKNTGTSFDDLLLMFGMSYEATGSARMAMMSLRGAMMQIADPDFPKKLAKSFKGVKATVDGHLRPMGDLLPELAAKMEKMTEAERGRALTEVFGGRAAGGLAAVLEKLRTGVEGVNGEMLTGADAVKAMMGELAGSSGEVDKALAAMSPYDKAVQAASASWSNLKRSLGESFLPMFTKAFEAVGKAVAWVATQFQKLPAPVKEFLGVFTIALGMLLTLGGAVKMAKGALMVMGVAFKAFGITAASSIAPILLWGAAIAGIVAIGYLVVKNWTAVKKFFVQLWGDIVDHVLRAWDKVKTFFSDTAAAVWAALSDAGNAVFDFFTDLAETAAETLMGLLDTVVTIFTDDIPSALWAGLMEVGRFFEDIANDVGSFFTETVPEKLSQAVSAIGDFFLAIGNKVWEFFSETIPSAVESAAASVKNFFLDIPVLGTALKGVGEAVDWIGGGMRDIMGETARAVGPQPAYAGAPAGAGAQASPWGAGRGRPGVGLEGEPARPAVAYAAARAENQRPAQRPSRPGRQTGPTTVNVPVTVQVDGEQVGQVVARTQRDLLNRAFEEPEEEA